MKWKDLKPILIAKLELLNSFSEPVIAVDGFVHFTVSDELQSAPMVGTTTPMLMFVGKKTGAVYLFSALQLLEHA